MNAQYPDATESILTPFHGGLTGPINKGNYLIIWEFNALIAAKYSHIFQWFHQM